MGSAPTISRRSSASRRALASGLKFPLIADSACEVMSAYGAKKPDADMSNRMTFVIDRNGKLVHINPDVDARSDAQYGALVESVSALSGG